MDINNVLNFLIQYLQQSGTVPGTQTIIEPNRDDVCVALMNPQLHMMVTQVTGVHLGVQILVDKISPEFKANLWSQIGADESARGIFLFVGSDGRPMISYELVDLQDASTANQP